MKESFLFVMLAPLQRRMELTAMGKRKSEELYGKAKIFLWESEEFIWKMTTIYIDICVWKSKEPVWKSERIYIL